MCEALKIHFHDRFARLPDIPVQEFCCYLINFPHIQVAEMTGYEGLVTECKVRHTLKLVDLNKSLGLDGFPYEMYLRMSHMFVPILTCFQPLVCPGSHPW